MIRKRKAVYMARPRTEADGHDVCELTNWGGDTWPSPAGMTWERVERSDIAAREAEGWLHPGTPEPRPQFDKRGFPLSHPQ